MDRSHGGTLGSGRWIESVVLRLKAWIGHDDVVHAGRRVADADPNPFPVKPSVLVVDDDAVNRLVVCDLLARWGIGPWVAADGAEAAALAGGYCFDLVLMDVQMPVLDGLGATREIRSCEREFGRPRVPVVAYTSMTCDRHLLQDSGMDDVLDKPCDAHSLLACLQRWCPTDPERRSRTSRSTAHEPPVPR